MGADMTLSGTDELIAWAERTGQRVRDAAGPALLAGAEPILEELQHTTDFVDRTGRLRKSMKISKVKNANIAGNTTMNFQGNVHVWVGDVDAEAQYAWPLERGSSRAKAHPFMRPAFERRKDEAYQRIRVKVKEAIIGE
jgi:HK97 gp10 family phage protein